MKMKTIYDTFFSEELLGCAFEIAIMLKAQLEADHPGMDKEMVAWEKEQEQRREKFGNYENETEIATHALNAILYGISTFWKQFIAFHFTGNSFCAKSVVDWIVSILRFCFKINLNPLLLSMDSGKSNVAV